MPEQTRTDENRSIIITRDLSKTFGEEITTQVLFNIGIELERNRFTAFIGPSGSGKSTLLTTIGLLDEPSGGEVLIDGVPTAGMDAKAKAEFRNRMIGFVFQFHYLLPEFTALENILIPAWIRERRSPAGVRDQALELMRRIGIEGERDKYISQMSGGQQQRVAIARALINQPRIVLADEPTGNLDQESSHKVIELLREIVRENDTTLVVVTHDRGIALKADRILELVDGRICRDIRMESATPEEVIRDLDEPCLPGESEGAAGWTGTERQSGEHGD